MAGGREGILGGRVALGIQAYRPRRRRRSSSGERCREEGLAAAVELHEARHAVAGREEAGRGSSCCCCCFAGSSPAAPAVVAPSLPFPLFLLDVVKAVERRTHQPRLGARHDCEGGRVRARDTPPHRHVPEGGGPAQRELGARGRAGWAVRASHGAEQPRREGRQPGGKGGGGGRGCGVGLARRRRRGSEKEVVLDRQGEGGGVAGGCREGG